MLWNHDGCWVSWEAEVIFRFTHEPVAVAVLRQNGGYKWAYEACRKDRSGHNVVVMWDNNVRMTLGRPWIKKV
jgi:hypothetical protein